jgi:glycosyltransferase involved in cell wall biosynthesis
VRVLVLSTHVPFPPVGGGRMRTYELVRALAAAHDVTLVGFSYGEPHLVPPFQVEVVAVPWRWPDAYTAMEEGESTATEKLAAGREPWFSSILDSEEMERTLRRLAPGFDLVLVEEADMGRFVGCLPAGLPVVLDLQNVYSAMGGDDEERTLDYERALVGSSALCLTCSELDASLARNLLGAARVEVVPNGVDTSFFVPGDALPDAGSLLFTGSMDYRPNVDAVRWFAAEILPLLPDARFDVVGAKPTEEVLSLRSERVIVHGAVPDVRPYLARTEQVVVPLLDGGGTRLKILEAAAAGKAIVTTSVGVAGLDFAPGEELLVADTADEFARAVRTLAGDLVLRDELGRSARGRALDYDWDDIGSRFRGLLSSVAALA